MPLIAHHNYIVLLIFIFRCSKYHFSSFFISCRQFSSTINLCLKLLLKDFLKSLSISSKLADTFPQLLNRHLVLVEIEAEVGFLVDVRLPLNIEGFGLCGVEFLGNSVVGGLEFF
jgi:hypothetical protein